MTIASRFLSCLIIISFLTSTIVPIRVYAASQNVLNLPAPGTMIAITPGFTPSMIRGIKIHPDNPLQFDFIVDAGHSHLQGKAFKEEAQRLVKYFLASLTTPEKDLWVNLSPYEKDRIIPDEFAQTEMGRDFLAQDYLLKQLSASLSYPENELGKKFWSLVYQKAQALYGTSNIPANTFNKVWIVPDKAVVYEHGDMAFVVESHLKVMMEEDYLALQKHSVASPLATTRNDTHSIGVNIIRANPSTSELSEKRRVSSLAEDILRAIIIPAIEKEVNEGENFVPLRQIQNSLVLATWFKKTLKESLLGKVYVDQKKTAGINTAQKDAREKIYQQYLQAYKKGVYNYIKEDVDAVTKQVIPRKYFAGGITAQEPLVIRRDSAVLRDMSQIADSTSEVTVNLVDAAMTPNPQKEFMRDFLQRTVVPIFQDISKDGKAAAIAKIRANTEIKPDGTPVTNYDAEIEQKFRDVLQAAYSQDGILGEEEDTTRYAPETWTIDPIDGTRDFTEQGPYHGTLLARYHNGHPEIAGGYWPLLENNGETGIMVFADSDGPGIQVNRRVVREADIEGINRSKVIYIGSHPQASEQATREKLKKYFEEKGYEVRDSKGGAGEVMDMILNGKAHLYIHVTPNAVDSPVSGFFAEKLGLKVSDRYGVSIYPLRFNTLIQKLFYDSLVIGTAESHAEALAAFREIGKVSKKIPWTKEEWEMEPVKAIRHFREQIALGEKRKERLDPYGVEKMHYKVGQLRAQLNNTVAPLAGELIRHNEDLLAALTQQGRFKRNVMDPKIGVLATIREIYEEKLRQGQSMLIGESGSPGSGKSTGGKILAAAVAQATKSPVYILREDRTLIQRGPVNLRGEGLAGKFLWDIRDKSIENLAKEGRSVLVPFFDELSGGNVMMSLDGKGNIIIHNGNRTIVITYQKGQRTFDYQTQGRSHIHIEDSGIFMSGSTKFRIRVEGNHLIIGVQNMDIINVAGEDITSLTEHEIDMVSVMQAKVQIRIPEGNDHLKGEADFDLEVVADPAKAEELRKANDLKEFIPAMASVVYEGQFAFIRLFNNGKHVIDSSPYVVKINYRAPHIVRGTRDWNRTAERGGSFGQQMDNWRRFYGRYEEEESKSFPAGVDMYGTQNIVQIDTTDMGERLLYNIYAGREQTYRALLQQLGINPQTIDQEQREQFTLPALVKVLALSKDNIRFLRSVDGIDEYQMGDFIIRVEQGQSSLSTKAIDQNKKLFQQTGQVMAPNTVVNLESLGEMTVTIDGQQKKQKFGFVSVWNGGDLAGERLKALAQKADEQSLREGRIWIDRFIEQELELHKRGVVDTNPNLMHHRRILHNVGAMRVMVVSPEENLKTGRDALEAYREEYANGSVPYLRPEIVQEIPEVFRGYYVQHIGLAFPQISHERRAEALAGFYINTFEQKLAPKQRIPFNDLPDDIKSITRLQGDYQETHDYVRNWDVDHPLLFKARLDPLQYLVTRYFAERVKGVYADNILSSREAAPALIWTETFMSAYPDQYTKFYQLLSLFYDQLLDNPDLLTDVSENNGIHHLLQLEYDQSYKTRGITPPAIDDYSWQSLDLFLNEARALNGRQHGDRAMVAIKDRKEYERLNQRLLLSTKAVLADIDGTVTVFDKEQDRIVPIVVHDHHKIVQRFAQLLSQGTLVGFSSNRRPEKTRAYAQEILDALYAAGLEAKAPLVISWESGTGGMDLISGEMFKDFKLEFPIELKRFIIQKLAETGITEEKEDLGGKINIYTQAAGEARAGLIQKIKDVVGNSATVVDGGEDVISIVPMGANKGRFRKYIQEKYHLSDDEMLVLVDQPQPGKGDTEFVEAGGIHVGENFDDIPINAVSTMKAIDKSGPEASVWVLNRTNFVPLNAAMTSVEGVYFHPQLDFPQGKVLTTIDIARIRQRSHGADARTVNNLLSRAQEQGIVLSIEGHLRGVDGPGSSLDLPEFQRALTQAGVSDFNDLPSTPTIASAFSTKVRFEPASDPEAVEYIAPDYGITEDAPRRFYGLVQLINGRTPNGQLDAPGYIFTNIFGLKGVRIILEGISPMALAGGMESSNVFNTALIAAASMFSRADLSPAEIFSLAVKLENDEFGGLTGGQGHLATLLGGAYQHMWLSGVKGRDGRSINPYSAVSIPLLTGEQLDALENHMMLVQAGKEYENGKAVVKRTAALINNMWTDLLRDQDEVGLPLHQQKVGLVRQFASALQRSDFKTAADVTMQYVAIRDALVRRWLNLMLAAHKGEPAPDYAREYERKVFDPTHPGYADYEVIRDIYNEKGEQGLRESRLYTLDPIAHLVDEAKNQGIAIMPLGAGGPGANLIAIDPRGKNHLQGFLEQQGLSAITEEKARDIIRGTGVLKGFMDFKVGKDPMTFHGFGQLGLTVPQLPAQRTVSSQDVGLADAAMFGEKERILARGGIDMAREGDILQIRKDRKGVAFPMSLQDIDRIKVNLKGLYPEVINVVPVNLFQLLGFADQLQDKKTTKGKPVGSEAQPLV